MTKAEATIRLILGTSGGNIRPLACAVDIAADLMFHQRIAMDDIRVTDDIYPKAANLMKDRSGKSYSPKTIARRIERQANLCWDILVERKLVKEYIGASIKEIRAPKDVIFYLAFYVYLDMPFFVAIQKQPALLF